jgi:hypothetical protein
MGFPSIILLAIGATALALWSGRKLARRDVRNSDLDDYMSEFDLDIGMGAQCPNCRSTATNARSSFEKRVCVVSGLKFELKD